MDKLNRNKDGFIVSVKKRFIKDESGLPLEKRRNVSRKEYAALCITKVGTQMLSITSGAYGAVFLYECFYGSQGIVAADVASISAILTTITTVLGYLMGVITATVAYKWKSRFGRYRQWFVLGLVPYVVINVLAFVVPDLSRSGLITFKFVISILNTVLCGFYGLSVNISQVISPNAEEKKQVITLQQIFSYIGYGLAYIVPFIFGYISKNTQAMYLTMIIMSVTIAAVGSILSFAWCKERIELPKKDKVRITGATVGLFKFKNYLIFHGINYAGIFALTGEMIVYLSAIVVGSSNALLFALPSAIGTAVGVGACTFISKKIEPIKILKMLGIYTPLMAVAAFLSVLFTGGYSSILFFICYFFFGISFGLGDMAKSHFDIEFNDFLEWKTGERLEAVQGIIPGWISSALNYGRTILVPFMLVWIGYETNVAEGVNLMEFMKTKPTYDKTCLWLLAIALFGTALQYLLRAVLLCFYDIHGEKKKQMYEELSVMRANRHLENLEITAEAENENIA